MELASIAWDTTERILFDAEHADILVIFDCCEAGSLCKTRSPMRFEYLAACTAGARTKAAGPKSFTRALIWALKELKNHERGWYSTSELRDKIYRAPNFPKDQNPMIGQRSVSSADYIVLAPSSRVLDDGARQRREGAEVRKRPVIRREYLDLRFEFHESVTDKVFQETGRALRSLIKESHIKAARITFIEKRGGSRWGPILNVVRAAVRLRKRQSTGQYSSHPGFTGIAVQLEPLASLLNSRQAASASNFRRATISSYPTTQPLPAVNSLFSYTVPRACLPDIVYSAVLDSPT